jgi:hypothetical protein
MRSISGKGNGQHIICLTIQVFWLIRNTEECKNRQRIYDTKDRQTFEETAQ